MTPLEKLRLRSRRARKAARRNYDTKVKELKKQGISFFPRRTNENGHKWFDKDIIFAGGFGELGPARTLFWPICVFWNSQTKLSFPSMETLSLVTGTSVQTIRKGLRILDNPNFMPYEFYGFEILKKRGRRHNVYRMELPVRKSDEKQGTCFKVWDDQVMSGFYRELKRNEKIALFGLKCHSQRGAFDMDLYLELEGENIELEYGDILDDPLGGDLMGTDLGRFWYRIYPNRKYDFISFGRHSLISKKQIANNLRMSGDAFRKAFNGLMDRGALEKIGKSYYSSNGVWRRIEAETFKIFTRTPDKKSLRPKCHILDEIYEKKINLPYIS